MLNKSSTLLLMSKLWINQIFFALPLSDKKIFLFTQVNLSRHETGTLPSNILQTLIPLEWIPYTLFKVKLCSAIGNVLSLDLSSGIHILSEKEVQSFKTRQVEFLLFLLIPDHGVPLQCKSTPDSILWFGITGRQVCGGWEEMLFLQLKPLLVRWAKSFTIVNLSYGFRNRY